MEPRLVMDFGRHRRAAPSGERTVSISLTVLEKIDFKYMFLTFLRFLQRISSEIMRDEF